MKRTDKKTSEKEKSEKQKNIFSLEKNSRWKPKCLIPPGWKEFAILKQKQNI